MGQLAWCDSDGWGPINDQGLSNCFKQSVIALAPVACMLVAAPLRLLSSSAHERSLPGPGFSRRKAQPSAAQRRLFRAKMGITVALLLLGPAALVLDIAEDAEDAVSLAYVVSVSLEAVCWTLSLLVLDREGALRRRNSWLLLLWWLGELAADSVVLVTREDSVFDGKQAVLKGNVIVDCSQFGCTAALALLATWAGITDESNESLLGAVGAGAGSPGNINTPTSSLATQYKAPLLGRLTDEEAAAAERPFAQWSDDQPVAARPAPLPAHLSVPPRQPSRKTPIWDKLQHVSPRSSSASAGSRPSEGSLGPGPVLLGPTVVADQPASAAAAAVVRDEDDDEDDDEELIAHDDDEDDADLLMADGEAKADEPEPEPVKREKRRLKPTANNSGLYSCSLARFEMAADPLEVRHFVRVSRGGAWDRSASGGLGGGGGDADGFEWGVWRRTRDFQRLARLLGDRFPDVELEAPRLASVATRGVRLLPKHVQLDQRLLQAFLSGVLGMRLLQQSPEVQRFLDRDVRSFSGDGPAPAAGAAAGAGAGAGAEGEAVADSGPEDEGGDEPATTASRARVALLGRRLQQLRAQAQTADEQAEVQALARDLVSRLPLADVRVRVCMFDQSITGQELVDWLISEHEATSRSSARELGQLLVEVGALAPALAASGDEWVGARDHFQDDGGWVYAPADAAGDGGVARPFAHPVSAAVVEWHTGTSASGSEYVAYSIEVTAGDEQWDVQRRFREFAAFHKEAARLTQQRLPALPSKGALLKQRKFQPAFLQQRLERLHAYLDGVVGVAMAERGQPFARALAEFLDPSLVARERAAGQESVAMLRSPVLA